MRGYLPSYELRRARTQDEALGLLAHQPAVWRPLAGGTDLMVLLAAGTLKQQQFVSIWGIPELRQITRNDEGLGIGALATFTDLQRHDAVQREYPLLCAAAAEIGGVANQNRATVGGNVANASPAADAPPALLACDADVELVSVRGSRRVPYAAFHTAYKRMDMAADEMIARIWLPPPGAAWIDTYRKVGARRAQAISKVCFAGRARLDGHSVADIRLAFGSVAPVVVRATRAESALRGRDLTPAAIDAAIDALDLDLAPIDDMRSTERYRRRVARNLLRDFLANGLGSASR